jgi:WD40 repeat protein
MFSPNGKTLAASDEFKVFIWGMPVGDNKREINTNAPGRQIPVAIAPDNRILAFVAYDARGAKGKQIIQLWELAKNTPITSWPFADPPIRCLAFNANGTILAGAGEGTIFLWKMPAAPKKD